MKRIPFFALLATLTLTTGCVVQNSTHSFQYHGTDNIAAGSEFFYVEYGLTGRSSTTYKPSGGGAVREGLVADAKRDLMQNDPLKANQAYANLSIDVIRTTKERVGRYGYKIIEVILQCVVSADVIQYGALSADSPTGKQNIYLLEDLETPPVKREDSADSESRDTQRFEVGAVVYVAKGILAANEVKAQVTAKLANGWYEVKPYNWRGEKNLFNFHRAYLRPE